MTEKDTNNFYEIKFINYFEDFDDPLVIKFKSNCTHSIKRIIEGLSTHYSGDPYEVYINNQKAVLEKDWGLL